MRTFCLCLAAATLAGMVSGGAELKFDPAALTPDIPSRDYPRLALLNDRTLIMADMGRVFFSTNQASSWSNGLLINGGCANTQRLPSGAVHKLTRTNWQPFVLPDGSVLLAYRSHSNRKPAKPGDEFYSSIRVMNGDAGAKNFTNELVLVETVVDTFRGFWEPFMVQLNSDTVALYYSDDHISNSYQTINYFLYSVKDRRWDPTLRIAVDGKPRRSRDGMPSVVRLKDGSWAMVIETFDYNRVNSGHNSVFVVGLTRSKDGKVWTPPVVVAAPHNLDSGKRCSAPFIAALPDGRVAVTYMTDEYYRGDIMAEREGTRVFAMVVSDRPLLYDTRLENSSGGPAPGFAEIKNVFPPVDNSFQIWNTAFCADGMLYVAGHFGVNADTVRSVGHKIRLRRAPVK